MKAFEFKPKLYTALKNYSKELFMADLMAGIIVGIVALPLAIAFGIASGVSPEKGIITAIIAGFIISLLGGSKVQIGGPTGAFIVIIYGIIQQYGEAGLIVATLMAGVILILLGGEDSNGDTACKAYDNRIGDKLNDCPQFEYSQKNEDDTRHQCGDNQPGLSVLLDNAVDNDDELGSD